MVALAKITWTDTFVDVNECFSRPCQNGGTCTDEKEGFSCQCPIGYTGPMCQTNVYECASDPCRNYGKCVDGVNSFTCQCLSGYTGSLCEIGGVASGASIGLMGVGAMIYFVVKKFKSKSFTPSSVTPGKKREYGWGHEPRRGSNNSDRR
nr:hypothetical protein BaRGS_023884 [Batillaria attramentaria]